MDLGSALCNTEDTKSYSGYDVASDKHNKEGTNLRYVNVRIAL